MIGAADESRYFGDVVYHATAVVGAEEASNYKIYPTGEQFYFDCFACLKAQISCSASKATLRLLNSSGQSNLGACGITAAYFVHCMPRCLEKA